MFFNKKITFLSSILFIFLLAGCTSKQEPVKKKEIIKVVKKKEYKREKISAGLLKSVSEIKLLLTKHDFKSINEKYIHKKLGYFDKYKFENKIVFKQKSLLNFKKNDKDYFSIENSINRVRKNTNKERLYKFNPKFNCSPNNDTYYGWNKQGMFLSETIDEPLLSKSRFINKEINKEEFEYSLLIDKTSYKLVFSEDEIIVYLSKIDKRWYITLFDRVQTDCSTFKKKRVKKVRKKRVRNKK